MGYRWCGEEVHNGFRGIGVERTPKLRARGLSHIGLDIHVNKWAMGFDKTTDRALHGNGNGTEHWTYHYQTEH